MNPVIKFARNILNIPATTPRPQQHQQSEAEQMWNAPTAQHGGPTSQHGGFNSGGSRSSGSKFPGALSNHTEHVNLNHWQLRLNTRDALFDSTQAKAIAERFSDSIVDTGLKTEFTPKWRQLGITEEAAQEWARDHEERFDLLMQSKHIDRAETQTGYQMQWLAAFFQQRDNDAFLRFHYSNRTDLISPLQISFLDPNQIRSDEITSTLGPQRQNNGIGYSDAGKEKDYKVWLTNKQGGIDHVTIPAIGARSKRISMIHMFKPEYAGQGRGYSRMAHALTEFEKLTDFSLAKIQAAINQTNIIGYVKPSADAPASNPMETMPNSGPIMGLTDSNTVAQVDGTDNIVNFTDAPEATQTRPGSFMMASLASGEELQFMKHDIQGDSYESFVNTFTGYLSASVGMPLEVLLMKFNNNYSASRATLVLFWRICMMWRQEMDSDMMTPIITSWLSEEIAAGRTQAPGWSDPRMRQAWLSHNLFGVPMPSIDPGKDAKADKDNLETGITTQERLARERNGTSARDNMSKNKIMFPQTPKPPWSASAIAEATAEENQDDDDNKTSDDK